ncbi:MAG TPA: class I SAM-dependent methyltransferase [Longimicrobiales bacterium]|nr:class I SAM-dependent methyltransferase [Longimicrobiales bacterium]
MPDLKTLRAAAIATRNVLLGGNLMALPLVLRPTRLIQYASENLFQYRAMERRRPLPERQVLEFLGATEPVDVRLGPAADAWCWSAPVFLVDLVSLCILCRHAEPAVVFEIGTFLGHTALHLALNSPDHAQVYTLDLPKGAPRGTRLQTTLLDDAHIRGALGAHRYAFTGSPVERKVVTLAGDSATFDFSPFRGRVDLFFIDGSHSYEYVRNDTLRALECCHPGSLVAWHDFGRMGVNGVSRWLRELAAEGRDIFVTPGGSLAYMRVA